MQKDSYFQHSSHCINISSTEEIKGFAENSSDYGMVYNFSPIRGNIVSWCDLGNKILEIGGELGAITETLLKKGAVTSLESNREYAAMLRKRHPKAKVITKLSDAENNFDSAVIIGSLEEYANGNEVSFLQDVLQHLTPDGKLIIAVDNSIAIGKLSGRAPETYMHKGYTKNELTSILKEAGLVSSSFLYPAPDYRFTNVIFSDKHLPDNESIKRRLIYSPSIPVSTFNENNYLRTLINHEPDIFPKLTDAFMVIASRSSQPQVPNLVCFSLYRKNEYMISTVIYDDYAVKTSSNEASILHIEQTGNNISLLTDAGINMLDSYENGSIKSRICHGKTFDQVLLDTYRNNGVDSFVSLGNKFFETVCAISGTGDSKNTIFDQFSVEISDEQRSKLHFLRNGFMDMIFQNCFVEDEKLFFYDQEWRFNNTPIEYIIFRAITNSETLMEAIDEDIFELFGISEFTDLFSALNRAFSNVVYSNLYKNWYTLHYRTPQEYIQDAMNIKKSAEEEKRILTNQISESNSLIDELKKELQQYKTKGFRYRFRSFLRRKPLLHKILKIILSPYTYLSCKRKQRIQQKLASKKIPSVDTYHLWLEHNTPTDAELNLQRRHNFENSPKFSILVPLYNTDEKMLREMILSVQAQTYSNWELCLADASDPAHKYVENTVKQLASKDDRIKYVHLKENLGIAQNTNACADMANGDYIALLDHDDMLAPNALYEIACVINKTPEADFIYTDEDKFSGDLTNRYAPHFKPDFSLYTLRSFNFICHLTVIKMSLFNEVGRYRSGYDGAQDYDLFLRSCEKATMICHIPKVLYHWRVHPASTASDSGSKSYAEEAGRLAIQSHITRMGINGEVVTTELPFRYRVKYPLSRKPLVSILIPNKDSTEDLQKCVDSILNSTYTNFEIVIIENNSVTEKVFELYKKLDSHEKIKVIYYPEKGFNYSKLNNFGSDFANGELLLLLNNDIESITPDWLSEMVSLCLLEDVTAVGARLLYPDNTVQHSGVVVGMGGVAGHIEKFIPDKADGYFAYGRSIRELSAVTAACLLVKRADFDAVGGLDEGFAVAFNDIDFCLKLRANRGKIVYTPYAVMHHYESKSRGLEDSPEKIARFQSEIDRFNNKWGGFLKSGDPFFNKNLRLDSNEYLPRNEKVL